MRYPAGGALDLSEGVFGQVRRRLAVLRHVKEVAGKVAITGDRNCRYEPLGQIALRVVPFEQVGSGRVPGEG
jgi:hypothetical protein